VVPIHAKLKSIQPAYAGDQLYPNSRTICSPRICQKIRPKSNVRPTLEKAEVNPEPTSQDVWPREPSPQFKQAKKASKSGFPASMVCQHLDDICAASPDLGQLEFFNSVFQQVAEAVGVRLAPQDAPDKAFGPRQDGTVFGVHYDTADWTWSIPGKKLAGIMAAIAEALAKDQLTSKQVRSLMGKLINIRPLIPAGKFNADHLMAALAESQIRKKITLSDQCKRQLRFWALMLESCNNKLTIPNPSPSLPPWAIDVFTDAAGGTLESLGRGVGGVLLDQWFYYPWSKKINSGFHRVAGKKMARKLAALEMAGPLVAIACAADLLRRQPVNFWVDNAGAVGAWRKGYSAACSICTTIAKAISYLAAALGATVDIKKIRRCSSVGPVLADHLSKAKFAEFKDAARNAGWALQVDPLRIPPPLLLWLHTPEPDEELGPRIARYWTKVGLPILGHT
jgi:hypothetical protein